MGAGDRLSSGPTAEHRRGDIVAPGVAALDVGEGGGDRAVAGLAHQVDQRQLEVAGGGEQAAAQRVAGEAAGIEAGEGTSLLDQSGDDLVRHGRARQCAGHGDAAEQRPLFLPRGSGQGGTGASRGGLPSAAAT